MRLFEQLVNDREDEDTFHYRGWCIPYKVHDCTAESTVCEEVMSVEQSCPLIVPPPFLRVDAG